MRRRISAVPDDPQAKSFTLKDVRDWLDVVSKLAIAVAGVWVGYLFSQQKQQNDDIKMVVEMATSPDDAKRLMGASIARSYQQQGRIPDEVFVAVYSYANNLGDKKLQAVVNADAAAASEEKPAVRQALTAAARALPIRIYFHIRQESDRTAAETIGRGIASSPLAEGHQVVVPGVELVAGQQRNSLLKCFRNAECDGLGVQLVKLFADLGAPVTLSPQTAYFEKATAMRPNHFEAWFAPGLK